MENEYEGDKLCCPPIKALISFILNTSQNTVGSFCRAFQCEWYLWCHVYKDGVIKRDTDRFHPMMDWRAALDKDSLDRNL